MNFALILFLLTLGTGVLWLVDRYHFAKRRAADAPEPAWVEYAASFFPVLLVVFFLRPALPNPSIPCRRCGPRSR
jgi:signal peptidase I